jgi:septal ring factor EnvC (AmiA/AmiB activator)
MFRIVKAVTLASLRAQADELASMRQQLTTAQQDAESARAEAAAARSDAQEAQDQLQFLMNDKTVALAELREAASDPVRGPSVRGRIAVSVLRDLINTLEAEAARTGVELDHGLRLVQAVLLNDDTDDGALPATATQGVEAN